MTQVARTALRHGATAFFSAPAGLRTAKEQAAAAAAAAVPIESPSFHIVAYTAIFTRTTDP